MMRLNGSNKGEGGFSHQQILKECVCNMGEIPNLPLWAVSQSSPVGFP